MCTYALNVSTFKCALAYALSEAMEKKGVTHLSVRVRLYGNGRTHTTCVRLGDDDFIQIKSLRDRKWRNLESMRIINVKRIVRACGDMLETRISERRAIYRVLMEW